MLYQLSYSHHCTDYSNCGYGCQKPYRGATDGVNEQLFARPGTFDSARSQRRCATSGMRLAAADADVLESQGAQASRIQQILGVYYERIFQEVLDAIEIEGAELWPAGADDQRV